MLVRSLIVKIEITYNNSERRVKGASNQSRMSSCDVLARSEGPVTEHPGARSL